MKIIDIVPVARGIEPADVIIKNAKIVNVFTGEVEESSIALYRKRIAGIGDYTEGKKVIDARGAYILPGFIDGHLHIESSMVAPREFARAVLSQGTTTVIADPHEISNVMGLDGLRYMIDSTEGVPLNVYIAIPSAVPATGFETAGARLGPEDMISFVDKYPDRIIALGEVMNFPGVLNTDRELITKIEILRHKYKKIDGHAPGLTGKDLNAYIDGFIRSDHESTTPEEALEKVSRGMHVLVREGTAAKNLEAIIPVITMSNQTFFSFCTDDRDPMDIIDDGHINYLIKKAVTLGLDPIIALRMATINTAMHYNLRSMGAIAPGYKADMVLVDNLKDFTIKMVIKDSRIVAEHGELSAPLSGIHNDLPETFGEIKTVELTPELFRIPAETSRINVIQVHEGDLYTETVTMDAKIADGCAVADPDRDIAKVLVFDRHQGDCYSRGFATGFEIARGAIATTIGHDSHNLCVMGMDDADMLRAVEEVKHMNGGIAIVIQGEAAASLPLPIAGLMSNDDLSTVVSALSAIKDGVRAMGSGRDILMTLHFIQLAVIPSLKLTDQGLVDITKQSYVDLFV